MPLDRAHITRSLRVMVPVYPAFSFLIGLNYFITPNRVLVSSPALKTASAMLPMPVWGGLFMVIGITLALAMVVKRRAVYLVGLSSLAGALLVWTVVMATSAIRGEGTPGAPLWPAFVTASVMGAMSSLEFRERAND